MKTIILVISLIFLFSFSIPTVKSPFVKPNPLISYYGIKKGIGPQFTAEAITKTCTIPSFTECPDGYECWEYQYVYLYTYGKKVSWSDDCLVSDPGSHNYKIRIPYDVFLGSNYTVTSKALFNGSYSIQKFHVASEFDFGTPTSPLYKHSDLDTLWTRVSNATVYSSPLGYGWDSSTNLYSNYSSLINALVDDYVYSNTDHTFNFDVRNGKYRVTLIFYDAYKTHDFIDVYAEGVLKVDNLNLTDLDTSTEVSFNATVSDGQLNIRLHDDGGTDPNWIINGIVVRNVDPVTEVTSMSTDLDFNYSNPGKSYVFDPSYVHGQDTVYYDCGVFWLNFTQTDQVMVCFPIVYKMETVDLNNTDLNSDGPVDIYDAIIFSNKYSQRWSLPVNPNDNTWRADINSDGVVNTLDATILRNQFGTNYIAPENKNITIWQPSLDPPNCGWPGCYSGFCGVVYN